VEGLAALQVRTNNTTTVLVCGQLAAGNIQGTFREHSGNIQGTFRDHSENIQGTFREHSGNIQGILSEALIYCINVFTFVI
jgi:hypothetical protein